MRKRNARRSWLLVATVLVVTLALAGCSAEPTPTPTATPTPTPVPTPTPTVVNVTRTIHAGQLVEWNLSDFEECRYHFTVRQTGTFGSVDIEFQGQRYTEKDGVFYGDTFTLSNRYSLGAAKVVDLRLRCQ